jgi:hypothetical protein
MSRVLIDQALKDSGWDLLDERRVRFDSGRFSGRALPRPLPLVLIQWIGLTRRSPNGCSDFTVHDGRVIQCGGYGPTPVQRLGWNPLNGRRVATGLLGILVLFDDHPAIFAVNTAPSVDRRGKAGDNFKTTLSAGVAPNSEEGE